MRILCACEESQAVTKAFRERGHEAYSCDLQPCSGGNPEWHIQEDALKLLDESWDMLIAFPPCTYLSNAGANRLRVDGEIQEERFEKARQAKAFFMRFYDADVPRIAIENPVPGRIHGLPGYSQIIHPYMFGDPWYKRTCLWLKGLPLLMATEICIPKGHWVGARTYRNDSLSGFRCQKMRSKTFPGVARAMAAQWG